MNSQQSILILGNQKTFRNGNHAPIAPHRILNRK
ncbi:hypothetical protein T01_13320 [Trichinella spiralis]|uniref:Uncharacterized protein n=1 Tax=Trichinella spiralis TaxID=6334 RepID=A0A0V0YY96_TRISP|nr:hypothetical protein T01_13320 [Trichinella spiralis]